MTRAQMVEELDAIAAESARRSTLGFTEYTFDGYEANWHHAVLARALDDVIDGKLQRLMVFMPPQNGKSELVSRRFPARALGVNPDLRILSISYSDDLATDMSRDVQRILSTPEYQALYPGTQLPSDRDPEVRSSDQFGVVGRRGYYKSAGIMSAITGKTADLILIDDPIKNRHEAESPAFRKRVWDQYTSSVHSRQFGSDAAIVLCQTRWHQDDLAGRLLMLAKNDPRADQWTVINFPAICEQAGQPHDPRRVGDALWPDKYPLSALESRKVTAGSYDWSALYQQRPSPAEGGLIKRAWFQWYPPSRITVPSERLKLTSLVISVDTALKAKQVNDPSAIGAWGISGADIFGLKVLADRWDITELIRQIHDLQRWTRELWPGLIPSVIVENTAAGPDVIAELRRTIPGVIADNPKGDKVQRLHSVLPAIEGGNVWLPGACLPDGRVDVNLRDLPSWVDPFVEECAAFPNGAHDDQVDQMTQALRRLYRPRTTTGVAHLEGL